MTVIQVVASRVATALELMLFLLCCPKGTGTLSLGLAINGLRTAEVVLPWFSPLCQLSDQRLWFIIVGRRGECQWWLPLGNVKGRGGIDLEIPSKSSKAFSCQSGVSGSSWLICFVIIIVFRLLTVTTFVFHCCLGYIGKRC